MNSEQRAYHRRYKQRQRDVALEREQLRSQRCPRRAGAGRCGGAIETYIDAAGRTRVRCGFCERRKAGICRDCNAPVYGAVGKALRCERHATEARRAAIRRSEERHREQRLEKSRAYYQNNPDIRTRRNEYKRWYRKMHPEKTRAQKKRYVEKHRRDPNSAYNRYHRRYRAKYRLQKREFERDRLKANPPARKTVPRCSQCGRSTRWRPVHKGNAGRPWTKCTRCLQPSERKIRMRNRRRALQRAKEWEASIPKPGRIRRPPNMAPRGPGWERTCITPGCDRVLTHRKKKCSRCREREAQKAAEQLAPFRGRGRRVDLERGVA